MKHNDILEGVYAFYYLLLLKRIVYIISKNVSFISSSHRNEGKTKERNAEQTRDPKEIILSTGDELEIKGVEVGAKRLPRVIIPQDRHFKAVSWVRKDQVRVHIEKIEMPIQGCGRVANEIRGGIGREPSLGSPGAGRISRVRREIRGLRHEALRSECRSPGHVSRTQSRDIREGREINGPRTRIIGRSRGRGREVGRLGPRSAGVGDWIISLGIHRSRRGDSGGSSACLPGFLRRMRFLGAEKVLDHVIRLLVN